MRLQYAILNQKIRQNDYSSLYNLVSVQRLYLTQGPLLKISPEKLISQFAEKEGFERNILTKLLYLIDDLVFYYKLL